MLRSTASCNHKTTTMVPRKIGPQGQILKLCRRCDQFKNERTAFYPASGTWAAGKTIGGVDVSGLRHTGTYCKDCSNDIGAENTRRRLTNPHSRAATLFSMAKRRAKLSKRLRHLPFTITPEHIEELLRPAKCVVTGIDLDMRPSSNHRKGHGLWNAPSLDRLDTNLGYVEGNVQVVCVMYNYCKNEFTDAQAKAFILEAAYNMNAKAKAPKPPKDIDGQMTMW